MNPNRDAEDNNILGHVVLPIAHEEDARKTAQALAIYDPDRVMALHVVEVGKGRPDMVPVEKKEEIAEDAFDAVQEVFPDAAQHIAYSKDIPDAIFDAADEIGASAIVYRSRGGGRITEFLSGDLSLKFITQADRPVVALPRRDTNN